VRRATLQVARVDEGYYCWGWRRREKMRCQSRTWTSSRTWVRRSVCL
jgi:hypothetical protein